MKKILSLLAVAAMAFTACTTDVTDDVVKNESVEYATPLEFGLALEETKAFMDDETTIEFEEGDFVGVYVTPVDANAAVTKNAKGTIHLVNGSPRVNVDVASFAPGDKVMVYYPYTTLNNDNEANSISLVINEVQVQPEVGRINCKNMPIVSVATNLEAENGGTILFRPVASIMKLNIYSDDPKYQGATIRRIKFQAEKHENVTGCNYCVGVRKAFDLTTITEDSAIEVPITNASRTTSYDVQVYAYTAFADYNEEGPTVAATSSEANPVYLIFFPGEYGGPKFDSANKSYINIHTDEYGRFDLNINSETPYTFDRAMIRPFNINLANTTNHAGVDVEYIHKNAIEYGTKVSDTGATIGNRANQLLADELIVIGSGSECLNMRKPINTAVKTQDHSENTRTIYAQTLDGAHGFRFKYYTVSQNTLKRGDKLKLQLGGLEIYKTKVADGEWEYWFDKLSPSNIFKLTPGCEDEIVTKEMYINELTAADINTDVKLKDVEFLYKGGAYVYGQATMAGDNHQFRAHYATMMQDRSGDVIFTCINHTCTWKRDLTNGTIQAPQGIGTVHGVLVHEVDPAYGDLGKYQIRPFDQTSFDIPVAKEYAVKQLVDWRLDLATVSVGKYAWNGGVAGGPNNGGYIIGANTTDMTEIPINKMHGIHGITDGSAVLYRTSAKAITSGVFKNNQYMPDIQDGDKGYKAHGTVADCTSSSIATTLTNHFVVSDLYVWNEDGTTYSDTRGIVMEFPATSVAGEMAVSFSVTPVPYAKTSNTGTVSKLMKKEALYGYPIFWKVDCSIDGGTTWTACTNAINGSTKFKMNPMVNWVTGGTTSFNNPVTGTSLSGIEANLDFCPGFTQQKFILPANAAGAAKVMLKLSPASTQIAWFSEASYKGSMEVEGNNCTSSYTYNCSVALEDLAVTYVK